MDDLFFLATNLRSKSSQGRRPFHLGSEPTVSCCFSLSWSLNWKLWNLKPDFTKKNDSFMGLNDLMGIKWIWMGYIYIYRLAIKHGWKIYYLVRWCFRFQCRFIVFYSDIVEVEFLVIYVWHQRVTRGLHQPQNSVVTINLVGVEGGFFGKQ